MGGVRHPGLLGRLSRDWITIREYAGRIRVRYGTVRRWMHEGMPVLRSHIYGEGNPAVRVLPQLADAWVAHHHSDSVAIGRRSAIYFARRLSDGAIKIGFSSDVQRRMKDLRKDYGPHEFISARAGDKPDELALHARFHSAHVEGEWFRPIPEILEEADAAAKQSGCRGEAALRSNDGPTGHARMRRLQNQRARKRKNSGRAA